ncbi:MAG: hypothetical protein RL637_1663 [Pseudomonadota bacterium]|jgi:hypothetical protein
MKIQKTALGLIFGLLLSNSILSFAATSPAGQLCATNVPETLKLEPYKSLNAKISLDDMTSLRSAMQILNNQDQYQALLNLANTIAAKAGATGRVVITLPDGTVVIDTKKTSTNTFDNFVAKAINENHNSRIAILDAQLWPCGIGIETRRSTSTGTIETYVARRVGGYLNSLGTIRISQ